MMASRAALAALALLALGAATPTAGAATPDIREYVVQPGDSVWSIAETFYGSGDKYKIIYKYNKFVGRPPYILKPGQVLRLPVGDKLPEAQVEWLKRDVRAKPPRSLDWLRARRRMNLWKLYKVSTGDESAVHIVFEDDSDLRLRDNALLVIYGGSSKRAQAHKRPGGSRLVLEKGTIRGGLAKLDADAAPMQVETPSGLVDLYSRLVQIQASAAASAVSVYDGKAKVSAQGESVEVPKGMGTVVKKGHKPQKPRPLPPVPGWAIEGAGAAVALVPSGQEASFEAAWQPVPRAASFRVELATDPEFKRVLYDIEVAAEITRLRLDHIAPGQYYARIAALDADGLEGEPSEALPVRVVEVRSSRRMIPTDGGGFEVVGFTRLTLPPEVAGELEWRVAGHDWQPGDQPLRLLEPGPREVVVRQRGATLETSMPVRVLAVTAKVEGPEAPLVVGGAPAEVVVSLVDEAGRPAELPGVEVRARGLGALPIEARGDGRYDVRIPPLEAWRPHVRLDARWLGGPLGVHEVPVAPLPVIEPYRYQWPMSRLGLRWGRRVLATALPDVTPVERFGARIGVVARDHADGSARLGVGFAGELSLLDDALGLDAEVTMLRGPVSKETSGLSTGLGDAELGARYLLVRGGALTLAPSLRVRLPLVERDDEGRLLGVEPGLLARVELAGGVWLDVRQAVVYAADLGAGGAWLSYAGDYALAARPLRALSLFIELDTAFGLDRPDGGDGFAALALGGGVLFHVDRLRLGLTLGAGLNGDGRAWQGTWQGGLSLEVGLGGPEVRP